MNAEIPLPDSRLHGRIQIRRIERAIQDLKAAHQSCLSVADWFKRDIPGLDYLMGEFLSTTTRMLLVAPTGLGKTNFTLALAFAMASGTDFLHWTAIRPARVLFIDGEMSRRLMKIRLTDAARRLRAVPSTLFVLCRDDYESMPPLNTPEGQAFVDKIIADIGGVDFAIFDNVQALTIGDMKDEESWQQTLPWIKSLTRRGIGQIWVHHTGIDQTRSYGTSTREWQLDTVALMEVVDRPGADIAFNLKFTKARERSPQNRHNFEPAVITLSQDQWASEVPNAVAAPKTGKVKMPSPKALAFHKALTSALLASGLPRPEAVNQPSVTVQEWRAECQKRGLIDIEDKPNSTRSLMSKYRLELVSLNWIACSDNIVWNRKVSA